MAWNVFKKTDNDKPEETSKKSGEYDAPEWCALSNRIKEQRNWVCDRCKIKTGKLRAHHKCYAKNFNNVYRELWDYPYENFLCLCDDCHSHIHNLDGYKTFRVDHSEDLSERIAKIKFDFEDEKKQPSSPLGDFIDEATDENILSETEDQGLKLKKIPVHVRTMKQLRYPEAFWGKFSDKQASFIDELEINLKKHFKAHICRATVLRTITCLCMDMAEKNPYFIQDLLERDGFVHQNVNEIF